MRILISDKFAPRGIEAFRKPQGVTVDVKTGLAPEELLKIIGRYDALCVRSKTKVTAEVLDAGKKLKVVGRAGTGVDNIDVEHATELGIVVMNTPGGNTITTAEHAISMMMALSRRIPQATASMKSGKWEKPKFMGAEVFHKRLGVIGLGNIGRVVADRAKGLKMEVVAFDPFLSDEQAAKLGVEKLDLDELLATSDYVTIHVPRSPETTGLIGAAQLRKMKKGARLIHCARGGIVDEKALAAALNRGHLAGAALDVFETEPPAKNNPLLKMDNVICTPHLGASTQEAQENVAFALADQVHAYLKKRVIVNAVNVPTVDPKMMAILKPYLELGERLGSFQGQRRSGTVKQVSVEYAGEITEYDVGPITTAIVRGFMKNVVENVNYVNAVVLARSRGIRIAETTTKAPKDYTNLITVTMSAGKEKIVVSGTKFGENDLRIVHIDGFSLEATPKGDLLLIHNQDKPGAIGSIGTTLGKAGINIASLQLGRTRAGAKAMLVVNIDSAPDKKLLDSLRKKASILDAKHVRL